MIPAEPEVSGSEEDGMEGAKMLDLAEAVHIDAPLTDVWRVVTDVRRHPELAGPKSITKAIDFDGPIGGRLAGS